MSRPSSLTDKEKRDMEQLWRHGNRRRAIAELFNLSRSQVWRICVESKREGSKEIRK